jgi:N-acetyl-anhydromuramyl-L-alanine amidase AmpD
MKFYGFLGIFKLLGKIFKKDESVHQHRILKLNLPKNTHEYYSNKTSWGYRPLQEINKVIVHQELGDGNTEAVHRYHTSPESHLKLGVGAPKIAYHFSIEKDGVIYQVNELSDVVWHCRGQNVYSVGIMLVGNYDGPSHEGTASEPPQIQLDALKWLLDKLLKELELSRKDVYGHAKFGKINCPGTATTKFLEKYRKKVYNDPRT